MGRICVIKDCGFKKIDPSSNISLHKFPKNRNRQNDWINSIHLLNNQVIEIKSSTSICSQHFECKYLDVITGDQRCNKYKLRENAIPTIFSKNDSFCTDVELLLPLHDEQEELKEETTATGYTDIIDVVNATPNEITVGLILCKSKISDLNHIIQSLLDKIAEQENQIKYLKDIINKRKKIKNIGNNSIEEDITSSHYIINFDKNVLIKPSKSDLILYKSKIIEQNKSISCLRTRFAKRKKCVEILKKFINDNKSTKETTKY